VETFVWNDHFLTGFATVDAQHRHLFGLINQIGADLAVGSSITRAAVDDHFRGLAAYAATHFKEEEHLMQEAGVPAAYFEHHAGIHRNFVAQVKTLWGQRDLMSAPAETIHGFLAAWLSSHILGEDQTMAQEIHRARGEATSPTGTDGVHSAATTDVLQQALGILYKELSRLNNDLLKANHGLEEKVAERTRELTTMLQKVQETQSQLLQAEKMASIGQLAAGVAHEINNPIGFVNSNLGTLGRYFDDVMRLAELGATTPAGQALKQEIDLDYLRTDLHDLLNESQDGLSRVRKIVANLKDFSRVDQAEWQEADLIAGLESTLSVAAHEIKYKADIVRELQPLPWVRCVPAQINQVLLNLLVNAAQALPEHGTITLRSGADTSRAWIEVADTGCGMDEATRRRIFEPFFTTKPVGTGTGLGMSVTYDIIKKHNGSIDVDSTPGVGTRIRIWLPIAGPETPTET
jgi:hemerythrin-like metal-binding protein